MKLREHFHPPLSVTRPWEAVHSAWATMLAQLLNRELPPEYIALPQTSRGPLVEIDVATLQLTNYHSTSAKPWTPAEPSWSGEVPTTGRDLFEVRILHTAEQPKLVGAIELVSPANKDRPSARQAFAGKCAGYLRHHIGTLIVDVVTSRNQELHRELLQLLELDAPPAAWEQDDVPLYAVSYRTLTTAPPRLELWAEQLALGGALPVLPLWLNDDYAVRVDLAASYQAACDVLKIDTA